MSLIIGRLGKTSLGAFELGRGIPQREGNPISIEWSADGTCSVEWTTTVEGFNLTASWDMSCSVIWSVLSGIAIGAVWTPHCTVVFISSSGSVKVTCISDGTISGTPPSPSEDALFDAPSSY